MSTLSIRRVHVKCLLLWICLSWQGLAQAPPEDAASSGGRPPWRALIGAETRVFAERAGSGHGHWGLAARGQAPVSRAVLATLMGAWEWHHSPAPIDVDLITRRLDLGSRMRWSDTWSGFGGFSLTTAAQSGVDRASTLQSARFFIGRRITDTLTLMLGGLWSERLESSPRWLGVPGIIWRPHPKITLTTQQGVTVIYRLDADQTLSFGAHYRRTMYRLKDRDGAEAPILTLSRMPLDLTYRRQAGNRLWVEIGTGVDLRPRETLSTDTGETLWKDTDSATWLLRSSVGLTF